MSDPHNLAFGPPVFSDEEREAIASFYVTWEDVCEKTPSQLPELTVLFQDPMWQRLRDAAAEAAQVFAERGRLPEEQEITDP